MHKLMTGVLAAVLSAGCSSPDSTSSTERSELAPGIVPKEEPKTFRDRVAKINASPAFFDALAQRDDPNPTINLNLLRFRPRGDRSRYALYGAVAFREILKLGGDAIYLGTAITDRTRNFGLSDEWDGVAYVMFRRRSAYLELQQSQDYQHAIVDRVAGTFERMLYLTERWRADL